MWQKWSFCKIVKVIDKIVEGNQFNGRNMYKFLEVYKCELKRNCILQAKDYLLWIHNFKNVGVTTKMHSRSKRLFSLWNYRPSILAVSFDVLTVSLHVSHVFFFKTVTWCDKCETRELSINNRIREVEHQGRSGWKVQSRRKLYIRE